MPQRVTDRSSRLVPLPSGGRRVNVCAGSIRKQACAFRGTELVGDPFVDNRCGGTFNRHLHPADRIRNSRDRVLAAPHELEERHGMRHVLELLRPDGSRVDAGGCVNRRAIGSEHRIWPPVACAASRAVKFIGAPKSRPSRSTIGPRWIPMLTRGNSGSRSIESRKRSPVRTTARVSAPNRTTSSPMLSTIETPGSRHAFARCTKRRTVSGLWSCPDWCGKENWRILPES